MKQLMRGGGGYEVGGERLFFTDGGPTWRVQIPAVVAVFARALTTFSQLMKPVAWGLLAWKLETGPVPALSHALERPGVACVSSDADLQGPSLYSRLSNQQQPRPVRYCDLFGGSVLGFGWVRCPTRRFRRRTSSAGRRRCCCRLRSVLLLSSAVGSGGSTN